MSVSRGHIGVRIGSELVDYRDHPAAAYLRNTEVAPGMTDNQRAALEQEGVIFPVVTDAFSSSKFCGVSSKRSLHGGSSQAVWFC
jgi:hypothetical protein